MNSKERLKEFIETDQIYKEWTGGKLKNPSDFDKYCIQHCEDIENLLRESDQLTDIRKIVLKADDAINAVSTIISEIVKEEIIGDDK